MRFACEGTISSWTAAPFFHPIRKEQVSLLSGKYSKIVHVGISGFSAHHNGARDLGGPKVLSLLNSLDGILIGSFVNQTETESGSVQQ